MDNYRLPVSVTDLYGKWKYISSAIINEGPLKILPEINIPKDEDFSCPGFSPEFIEDGSSENSLCQLFIISFNGKFEMADIKKIKEWRDDNPDKGLLTIILVLAKSQWSFTTQRSKIEARFSQYVENSDIVIGKYYLDDCMISDSDIKQFHTSLQNTLKNTYQKYILSLQAISRALEDQDPRHAEVSRNLANFYQIFGYFSASKLLNRIIISSISLPFWPEVPELYDFRKPNPNFSCKSGFDILNSSLHGIFKSSQTLLSIQELSQDITWVFAITLQNCTNFDQEVFARYWIYNNAFSFLEYIESYDNDTKATVERTFSEIILTQMRFIMNSKIDLSSPFFHSIVTSSIPIIDAKDRENRFLSCLDKNKKLFDAKNHQTFFSAIKFLYLMQKDDTKSALDLEPLKLKTNKNNMNYIVEEIILESLFNNPKTLNTNVASMLLERNGTETLKLKAFEYLSNYDTSLSPQIPIDPILHLSEFYKEHELFENVSFDLSIKLPNWLNGIELETWIEMKSKECTLKSDITKIIVSKYDNMKPTIFCKQSGTFDKMILMIRYKSLILWWNLPIKMPLIVMESSVPPTFNFKSPFLLCYGQLHSSLLITTIHDTSCTKLTFKFKMETLKEIQLIEDDNKYVKFDPNDIITVTQFSAKIKIRLIYVFKENSSFYIECSTEHRDGEVVTYSNHYDFPSFVPITVHLFKQTQKYHQFQIYNPFPQSFTFEHNGNQHKLPPISTYYIIRELSDEPLKLTYYENGWEGYPVEITTSHFKLLNKNVQIETDNLPWIVGQPKIVKINPPASPMVEKTDHWVVAQQDDVGSCHCMIPTFPGRIRFPKFQAHQQIVECSPKYIDILPDTAPAYNVV